jgi:hypothetical protein
MKEKSYGWWITLFAFFTFGIAAGISYYGGPERIRVHVTLGFPLAATMTLWVVPLLVHRLRPGMILAYIFSGRIPHHAIVSSAAAGILVVDRRKLLLYRRHRFHQPAHEAGSGAARLRPGAE